MNTLRWVAPMLGTMLLGPAAEAAEVDPLAVMEARHFAASNSIRLPYRLLKPATAAPNTSYPLVLFLHGAGGRGDNNRGQIADQPVACRRLVNEPLRSQFPCYLLAPQCPNNRVWADWTIPGERLTGPTPALVAVLELVAAVRREFPIDAHRIYVTGLSMGGLGTFVLLAAQPDLFAAAAPVCGGGNPSYAARFAKVPLWAFHGADDTVVPARRSREMIAGMKAAGGSPKYTEYPKTGHDSWHKAYWEDGLYKWLFGCRRED